MKKVKSAVYDENYFLNLNRGNKEFLEGNIPHEIKKAIEIAKIRPNMHVLDIGCGRGETGIEIAKLQALYTGIDYSFSAISLSKKYLKKQNKKIQKRVRYLLMDVNKLNFKNKFDRIFLLDIVEHLNKKELQQLINNSLALLNGGGIGYPYGAKQTSC